MSNYLVTGAAGFIAACLVDQLLDAGHTVAGLDNMNDAYDVRIKEHRLQKLLKRPGFTFYKMDISDPSQFGVIREFQAGAEGRFDAIINLAARAGVRQSVENPWVYVDTNVTGTLNLLERAHQNGIPKFIMASTSSIYGANAPLPTPEDADSSHPLQAYAATKKGAEVLCHAYRHLYGLDVTVLRFFTVYGPAGRPDLAMFRFVQWIVEGRPVRINGDGHQSRGFTYVDDIARGIMLALKPVGFEVINLGGHETIEILDLVRMVERKVGHEAKLEFGPRHPADMWTNWANVEKARRLLGWEPQVNLEEGVQRLVDWYMAERSWACDILTVE